MLTAKEARELMERNPILGVLDAIKIAAIKGHSSVPAFTYVADRNWNMTTEEVSSRWSEPENTLLGLGYTVEWDSVEPVDAPGFEVFTMKVSW